MKVREEQERETKKTGGVDSPNHRLDLLPVLWVDLISVLWSHQHGGEAERRVFQSGSVTLDDR